MLRAQIAPHNQRVAAVGIVAQAPPNLGEAKPRIQGLGWRVNERYFEKHRCRPVTGGGGDGG